MCPEKTAGLKPDYGLRRFNDGLPLEANLYFYEFRLYSISVLGNGDYSTMVELRYDGEVHALSLDFNHAQLEEILARADPKIAVIIRNELSRDPISVREVCCKGTLGLFADKRARTIPTPRRARNSEPVIESSGGRLE
jgi:hypothetical protein